MQFEDGSRKIITDVFRKEYPALIPLYLKFCDCVLRVRMNSVTLKDKLARYFQSFTIPESEADIDITVHEAPPPSFPFNFKIKKPDPGKTKIKEEYVDLPDGRIVRKRLTGMHFIFGLGDNLAIGPCAVNINQVINFINNRYIEWKLHQGCLLGHAAGVCLGKNGLALAGFSGKGKSTLALHMLSLGVDFVSNDRLMVMNSDQGLTMFGVAKHPRINPGTALNNENLKDLIPKDRKSALVSLTKEALWHLEEKYDAPVETFFRTSRFKLSAPMNGLFILNWNIEMSSPPVFEKIKISERPDLLRAFMKTTGLFYQPFNGGPPADPSKDEYIRLLEHIEIIEIKNGVDFNAAARFGLEFLKKACNQREYDH